MTRAEDSALRSLVLSDSEFAKTGKLFDGEARGVDGKPITGTWYLVMQPGADEDTQERLSGPYAHRQPSMTFQCVGTTTDQARWVAERLDSVLRPGSFGVVMPIAGRSVSPLKRDYLSLVQRDADVSPPMWFQTVEYSFRSDPA